MVLRIGHRGAAGYEPENTLRSFEKALALDVGMIELDVHLCKTGQVVVIHDTKVDRTTNGTGFVADKAYDDLTKLDAGKGERIPTLVEVLDLVDRRARVNIELKARGAAKPVAGIVHRYITEKGWSHSDFLISSYDIHELMRLRELDKRVRIGKNLRVVPKRFNEIARELGLYSVHPWSAVCTKRFVSRSHNLGLKVYAYTVDTKWAIDKLKAIGVDGVFSNFPDRI